MTRGGLVLFLGVGLKEVAGLGREVVLFEGRDASKFFLSRISKHPCGIVFL